MSTPLFAHAHNPACVFIHAFKDGLLFGFYIVVCCQSIKVRAACSSGGGGADLKVVNFELDQSKEALARRKGWSHCLVVRRSQSPKITAAWGLSAEE